MFGLSFTSVLIIAALALILLGPDQLPSAARTMGKALRELRRATDDLRGQFQGELQSLEQDVEGRPRPTLVVPVEAMPVPGVAEPPPAATRQNVPFLEAAQVELAPPPAEASAREPAAIQPSTPQSPVQT